MKTHLLFVVLTALIFLWSAYYLFASLYPYNVIEVKNPINIQVVPNPVYAGGEAGLVFNYCKNMNLRSKVTKNLINNDIVYTLVGNRTSRPIPIGCHEVILTHQIPKQLTGKAKIYIYASYQPNPFRTINYEWQTEEFTILATREAVLK